jgi:hypothetical protein
MVKFFNIVIALLWRGMPSLSADEPPNVILAMADDLGWGDVGFNGGKIFKTPHLDEMAGTFKWCGNVPRSEIIHLSTLQSQSR